MALKLGKCRLCLKLGDFYSIFTVDNSLQLAEMAMECARIKIYDGDGLPDKVCSECIQKLSSAHIFKQQCERSDQELRRNYVPPPGFTVSPTPNRQSSDSAFSSQTELSKPASSGNNRQTPVKRNRKRSRDSIDNASESSYKTPGTKSMPLTKINDKRARLGSDNGSDYDDSSINAYSADSDYDYSAQETSKKKFPCNECDKSFDTERVLNIHRTWHTRKKANDSQRSKLSERSSLGADAVVDIPKNNIMENDEDKLSCDKCGKVFKLKIMLKRHYETCQNVSPKKELLVSLEPIDGSSPDKKYSCEMCPALFKTYEGMERHMKSHHAAVVKGVMKTETSPVGCMFCKTMFSEYSVFSAHFHECTLKKPVNLFECQACNKLIKLPHNYLSHVRCHLEPGLPKTALFSCRMCNSRMHSQEMLIKHLAAHVEGAGEVDDEPRSVSTPQPTSELVKCRYCDVVFSYKKALEKHELKHINGEIEIKTEPVESHLQATADKSQDDSQYDDDEASDASSQEDSDNTCDICEKTFSYKRLLLQHKRTKHNMSSGTKRANILVKDCKVRCLICDLENTVDTYKQHNQIHITAGIKPRNMYTCLECNDHFKSKVTLCNHIKLVHRLKKLAPRASAEMPDLADFCEVVVTKSEPLDVVQSHSGGSEVPSGSVDLSGFTCPLCGKKMPTLLALKRHVNWHSNVGNKVEKSIECFVCKETFRFKGHFRLHMRGHYRDPHLDPQFLVCSICNKKSKHLRAAQMHMNFHKQTRFKNHDYECAICKKVFQVRRVYLSHMAIHLKRGESLSGSGGVGGGGGGGGTTTCLHCGKVCDSEASLKHHVSWHKSKNALYGSRYECPLCDQQFTNKKTHEMHLKTHYEDDNGPFKCHICGKGYTEEEYFKRHVKGHNFDHQSHKDRIAKLRVNKVKCPICEKYYPDLEKLIRHLRRTHPQSKMIKEDPDAPPQQKYSCKLCAKVFLDPRRLQHHQEAHLRKPEFFKCKFCGKKTISLKNHRLHIKTHLVKKHIDNPLKCMYCEETFIKGYDLHYHLRDVHQITETWIAERSQETLGGPLREFQCSICLKVLASQGNYERHIDYHNSLRCNYCFDYFSSLRFLDGHLAFSCEKKKLIGPTEVYPRKIKCHVCYKAFHVQVKLDCHLRTQHSIRVTREAQESQKDIVCDYCFRVFENEESLASHKVYHRTIGYLGCIYCDRKFNTMTLYRKHKNHHFSQLNVDNPTKCEHCDETFVAFREMIYHMKDEHGDDKEWVVMPKESIEETCPICNKVFYNLPRHVQYHEDNRCKKCAEYFYSRTDFDNHLCAIDSDDEPENNENDLRPKYEECRFCFKAITKGHSTLKHDLIHKGSGSISCRLCKSKFKTIDAYNIHSFSHRSRKYDKRPIRCRTCGEKFVKYGPFIRHLKEVHKSKEKMHYRATVLPEKCEVCGDYFPNLHNHYRAHLLNQCQLCFKYFTSSKVFSQHQCDKEDSDLTKVFVSDLDLVSLIKSYVPKEEKDVEKHYNDAKDEEEEEEEQVKLEKAVNGDENGEVVNCDEDSQLSEMSSGLPLSIQSPIISDVLSLYQANQSKEDNNVIDLEDDDSVDFDSVLHETIEID